MKASIAALVFALSTFAAEAREKPRDLDTPRTFPEIYSKAEWRDRAREIHDHVLVSCGLWPMPEKTPLNAHVFGRIERDGYSIEKVYFETYPGFFLGGNLYRPLGQGNGPFPGVLNPHGHWDQGRLVDTDNGSVPARCISFARQGMVAFAYDMAGYNDTKQVIHRGFATNPTNLLWSVSMMGLQTWNSIRALDFLESLPDVDRKRLACTGASGGGTQTFMLGAADSRLAAQAPIVMVSHTMQGGCLCENAPGLRVDYSNMEIAAAPVPRPQILVGSTGDWTRATMTMEGPALQHIYDLFGASDRLRYTVFNFNHNYNQTTREAVYPWFGKWLLHDENPEHFKEQPHTKEADADMLAFSDGKLPEGALTQEEFLASIIARSRDQLEQARPHDRRSLKQWKQNWRTAWEHDLQLSRVTSGGVTAKGDKSVLKRNPDGVEIAFETIKPSAEAIKMVVIVAGNSGAEPSNRALAQTLASGGAHVLLASLPSTSRYTNQFTNFFCTYNRTLMQEGVADLKALIDYAHEQYPKSQVVLAGTGNAGLACLAAAPLASAIVADCAKLDDSTDEALLTEDVFFPGLRRVGSFNGIAALAAPNPLLLHNTGNKLNLSWLDPLYRGEKGRYRKSSDLLPDNEVAEWILKMAKK